MNLERLHSYAMNSKILRPVLALAECLYAWGYRRQHAKFEAERKRGRVPKSLPIPVISVGNIVAGGAGKTPMVENIFRQWQGLGGQAAVLSRGYGAQKGEEALGNDEFRLLARRNSEMLHIQNPDRFAGGQKALSQNSNLDLMILDDGFQHRKLHRDIDLVVLDATRPFGYGRLLPAGYLREPWQSLERADLFVISRLRQCSMEKRRILLAFLKERFPKTPIYSAESKGEAYRDQSGEMHLKPPKKVLAFAGIGNPEAFFKDLKSEGLELVGTEIYSDHYNYQSSDCAALEKRAKDLGAEAMICTEKDGVKLESLEFDSQLKIYEYCIHYELSKLVGELEWPDFLRSKLKFKERRD